MTAEDWAQRLGSPNNAQLTQEDQSVNEKIDLEFLALAVLII